MKVSVIIPTYRDWKRLKLCLSSLMNQTIDSNDFEIIIVNNDPQDKAPPNFELPRNSRIIEEVRPGSYAARNRAIGLAIGDVLAFTDSDCVPSRNWIQSGLDCIHEKNVDLVGGNVQFIFSKNRQTAEIYDSITNMQIKHGIESKGVGKTANLFVKKTVFSQIGYFPDDNKSGGDVMWTSLATKAGYKIAYSPDAFIKHPTRSLGELVKKSFRVGTGQIEIWKNRGNRLYRIGLRLVFGFRPKKLSNIRALMSLRLDNDQKVSVISIWFVAWICEVATNLGRIKSLFEKNSI